MVGTAQERLCPPYETGFGIGYGHLTIEDRKTRARAWFEALRDDICASFERLEDDAPQSLYPGKAGRFNRLPKLVDMIAHASPRKRLASITA